MAQKLLKSSRSKRVQVEGGGINRRFRSSIVWAVALLGAFVFHGSYARHGLSEFDTGMLVADVARVMDGDVFGRDFVAPYGPIRVHAIAVLFSVFGSSLAVLAWGMVVLRVLLDALTFWTAKRLVPGPIAWVPTLAVALAHGSFHKQFLALSAFVFLIPLYGALKSPTRLRWALLGSGIALSGLIRYDMGGISILVTLVSLVLMRTVRLSTWRRSIVHLLWVIVGGSIVALMLFLCLFWRGFEPLYWWDMTWQRIAVQEWIDFPFPWPWSRWMEGHRFSALTGVYLILSPVIVFFAMLMSLRWMRQDWSRGDGVWFFSLSMTSLFLLNQARLIPSFNHFLQGAAPLFITGATLIWRMNWSTRRGRVIKGTVLYLSLGILGSHVSWGTRGPYPGSFTVRQSENLFLSHPRARVWIPRAQHEEISGVLNFLETRSKPGDLLVCSHSCPIFYFLSGLKPGIPYSEPSYYYRNEKVQSEAVQELERHPPRFFIYDPNAVVGYSMRADSPILLQALVREMRPVLGIGRYVIYERSVD